MKNWTDIILDNPEMWPDGHIVELEEPFEDDRGFIQMLVNTPIKNVTLIKSYKVAIRANHYHKTDWHYCYVISGRLEYLHRPTGSDKAPAEIVVNEGEMVFTPPMIDHGMRFPVDTVFLTLGRNPRDQATYEADVVRVDFMETEGWTSWRPGEVQSRGEGGND